MSEQSIEDVLADVERYDDEGPMTVGDVDGRSCAAALAIADLPLVDRERGIAVIRLDPTFAEGLMALANAVEADGRPAGAEMIRRAARIIGGES